MKEFHNPAFVEINEMIEIGKKVESREKNRRKIAQKKLPEGLPEP